MGLSSVRGLLHRHRRLLSTVSSKKGRVQEPSLKLKCSSLQYLEKDTDPGKAQQRQCLDRGTWKLGGVESEGLMREKRSETTVGWGGGVCVSLSKDSGSTGRSPPNPPCSTFPGLPASNTHQPLGFLGRRMDCLRCGGASWPLQALNMKPIHYPPALSPTCLLRYNLLLSQ